MTDTTSSEVSEYRAMGRIVLAARIAEEITAREAAAMLSKITKAERAGEPCPGYATMLEEVRND